MVSSSIFGCSTLSPRRRRTRPNWNQQQQKQKRQQVSDRSSSPLPLTEIESSSTLISSPTKKPLALLVATTCLVLLVVLLGSTHTTHSGVAFLETTTNESQLALRRRRLLPSSQRNSNKPIVTTEEDTVLRYLTFGGPLTYGRGLDEAKRTSEAYPYLLSPSSANGERVRNVAHPSHDTMGPTMVSLCTQSIVEGMNSAANANANALALSSSIDYDVITLEYSFASTSNPATSKDSFLSSIRLLVRRLRQRYPQANILLVRLWTPSDLLYYDVAPNRTVSYDELRSNGYKQKQQNTWIFRELSIDEQEVKEGLQSMMDFEGGLIYNMPRPKNINDDESLNNILQDWFLEEQEEETSDHDDEIITNNAAALSSSPSYFRYTLSRRGHRAIAEGILELLKNSSSIIRSSKRQNNRASFAATNRSQMALKTPPNSSSHQQKQVLNSWGSGDFCRLWYESGTESLPNPNDYSNSLHPNEIVPGLLQALEVRDRTKGATGAAATLNIHNPFDTDRIIYLTYLTTSEAAAANKVYPKIKVKVVVATESDEMTPQHQTPTPSSPSSTTSVILNPSHSLSFQQPHHQQYHHLTRTSAVGLLPAFGRGTMEFATLEEYTVHPFRIVGVSILPDIENENKGSMQRDNKSKIVPFEFAMFSPRRLSVDNTVDDYDNNTGEFTYMEESRPRDMNTDSFKGVQ